jgi:formamidopyrimidine-DNA glycosylase
MPELPEVETIAKILRQGGPKSSPVIGKKIRGAHLLWNRTLATPSPSEFQTHVLGQKIEGVNRRGKFLLLPLSADTLLIHLGMSGDLLVEPVFAPPDSHHRLMLDLEGERRLSFNDTRKFGRVWLTSDPASVLGHLGPEPLSKSFTAEDLFHRLHTRRRQLKPLLLDQRFLAGLGNIYTDEALHLAKLHPLTISNKLNHNQAERLWNSIRHVLKEGIRHNGASIDWVFKGGEHQLFFRVYQRTDKPCPECETPVRRIEVGQRGTHFCPTCQPGK